MDLLFDYRSKSVALDVSQVTSSIKPFQRKLQIGEVKSKFAVENRKGDPIKERESLEKLT